LGGQFIAWTRHTGLKIPGRDRRFWTLHGRDKTYWVDNSRQGQEILDEQFLAGTRHTELTIPGRDRRFFSLSNRSSWHQFTPPQTYLMDSGVKRSGCDFDLSNPSNCKVMNQWSYTSSSPVILRGA